MDFMVLTVKFQSKVFHQLVAHLQLLVITVMVSMLNLKRSTNITINTITLRKILVIKESMRKSMDLLPTTDLSSHNHGEEPRKLTHKTDLRTQLSNGSINQLLLHRKISRILETKVSMRKSMDLLLMINPYYHSHGEELRKLTQSMDLRTHHSNGLINQLLLLKNKTLVTQNT
jgi:hypothetical protein